MTLAVSGMDEGMWSYSYRNKNTGVWSRCKDRGASVSSVIVWGLESGTPYDFRVYRGASCALRDQVTLKAHTISLTSGSVGQSSATLKLEHYEGEWHHKQAGASGGAQASGDGDLAYSLAPNCPRALTSSLRLIGPCLPGCRTPLTARGQAAAARRHLLYAAA